MTRVLVPVADGTEEMEAVIVIDALRRAGWDVVCAGLKDGPITASRRVRIIPDTTMDKIDASTFDLLVVPGGARGVENLRADARVLDAIRAIHGAGRIAAAVCAGPLVLQEAGILRGKKATCHPGVAAELTDATRLNEKVVIDGNLITSQGAGTCFDFALAIIEKIDGSEKAAEVRRGMVVW